MKRFLPYTYVYVACVILAIASWFIDAHAVERPAPDLNNHINRFEHPVLYAGDTCRAGYYCVQAPTVCDQVYTDAIANWGAINQNDDVICLTEGDYRPLGELTWTVGFGGTVNTQDDCAGNYKWIVRYTGTQIDAQTKPWELAPANKVQIEEIDVQANCINMAGLSFIPDGGIPGIDYQNTDGGIINNIDCDHSEIGATSTAPCIRLGSAQSLQRSYIHDFNLIVNKDRGGVSMQDGDEIRIVANEFVDIASHQITVGGIPIGASPVDNVRFENNDHYTTQAIWFRCSDNTYASLGTCPDGDCCMCTESFVEMKRGGQSAATKMIVSNNRYLNAFRGDPATDCNATGQRLGGGLVASNSANWILIERNIFDNCQTCLTLSVSGEPNSRMTVRRNWIVNGVQKQDAENVMGLTLGPNADFTSVSQNTFAHFEDAAGGTSSDYIDNRETSAEYACNTAIDAKDTSITTTPNFLSYTMLVGDSENPGGTNNETFTVAAANLDEFCYWRKLMTVPERICHPNVVPTNASPTALKTCGATKQPGYGSD